MIKVVLNPAPAVKLSDELLKNLYIITPNETEAELLTGIKVTDEYSALKAAKPIPINATVSRPQTSMQTKAAASTSQWVMGSKAWVRFMAFSRFNIDKRYVIIEKRQENY